MTLSIIIPVYNAAPFLKRCIESILNQDYTDFELIIVDDGSTDGSAQICDEIAKTDVRLIVLHQNNSGVNTARLNGVKMAKGEYIMFVDADDMLPDHAITLLMKEAAEGYDIIKGGHACYQQVEDLSYEKSKYSKDNLYLNALSYALALIEAEAMPFLWGGIYKRCLLEEHYFNLLSDNKITIGEDFVFNLLVSRDIKKAKTIPNIVYNYFINSSSVMNTKVTSSNYFDRVFFVIKDLYQNEDYQHLLKKKKTLVYLHNMFVPEFGYSKSRYNSVKDIFCNKQFRKEIEKARGMRYLYFFDFPILYKTYSKMYCFLFLKLKLKGRKRIVID